MSNPASCAPGPDGTAASVRAAIEELAEELTAFRRDLHAHPELSWAETRTTSLVAARLEEAGARVELLPTSGLVADLGPVDGPRVALRADLDALPVDDRTEDPWRSAVPGVAHACGHDVHTTALLGAGLALSQHADRLESGVRLLFQPAEEVMPGGALALISAGVLAGVEEIFMLHCDPSLEVGEVGLRVGAVTAAADSLEVRLTGRGGHTSRPHLTEDLTFALGKLVTELPAVLSRRLDPRAGVSLVWGLVQAGSAMNVIPSIGRAAGTVRMLDAQAWAGAEKLVRTVVEELMAPYGVLVDVDYAQGVPPVVNTPGATERLAGGVVATLGPAGLVPTAQSLGGEDFAWYLEHVPGAMARLGTRTPGGPAYDLHRGDLRIDERAVLIGAQVLASTALRAGAGT